MRLLPVLAIVIAVGLGGLIIHKMVAHGPDAIRAEMELRQQMDAALKLPPIQTDTNRASFAYKEFRITPRAEYDITARVLSTQTYHWNMVDDFFKLAPEDLALGWGALSDYKNRELLHVRQEDRFFKYSYRGQPPYPPDVMIASMANTHIVPANTAMADKLGDVRPGDIVHMTGALIDILEPGKGTIHTSLTRTDSGPGACEILWLETLQIERD